MISLVVISKDEPALADTLVAVRRQLEAFGHPFEIVVVDASDGRLSGIAERFAGDVRWLDFAQPPGVAISIPHQRNEGVRQARGDLVVFTDCGCIPDEKWLEALIAPILDGTEAVTAGLTLAAGVERGLYDAHSIAGAQAEYLHECPTINLAFTRDAYAAAGPFDEGLQYGSDVEWSWRLADAGLRIRSVPAAVIRHDWGDARRQLRRSYQYGRARAQIYLRHPGRLKGAWRRDPMIFVYPAYLLGLPLLRRTRGAYLAPLAIPAWRNRQSGALRVLADHLAFGLGVLSLCVRR